LWVLMLVPLACKKFSDTGFVQGAG